MIRSKYIRLQGRMYQRPLMYGNKQIGAVTMSMNNGDICITIDDDKAFKKFKDIMFDKLVFTFKDDDK